MKSNDFCLSFSSQSRKRCDSDAGNLDRVIELPKTLNLIHPKYCDLLYTPKSLSQSIVPNQNYETMEAYLVSANVDVLIVRINRQPKGSNPMFA